MTDNDAAGMLSLLTELFPHYKPTTAQTRLWVALFRPYQVGLCRAAIEGYTNETLRKEPIHGDLRRKLLAMEENSRGSGGPIDKSEAERAKWAEWRRQADSDDEVTRAWIGSMSDAEISRIAQREVDKNPMLIGIFGAEDAGERAVQKRVKGNPPIVPSRIRDNFFARGMLRAFADIQAEAAR
jgi:hypothetical protein